MTAPAKILIVDDEPLNVDLLEQQLEEQGYETCAARNGIEALEKLSEYQPDLMLLDWMMPGMDGIEVLAQLRADPRWRALPVIMLTARGTTADKVAGLDAGADDYLSKPIDEAELGARIRAMLRLARLEQELLGLNRQLQQALEEKEKAQELLIRSESMAAIGTLAAGAAHELNNPLGAAFSLVQSVQEMLSEDSFEQLQQERAELIGHLAFSLKELQRAKEIVASLLDLSSQTQDYTEAVDLKVVVQDALRILGKRYQQGEVEIAEQHAAGVPAVVGNFAQLGQVCLHLIQNALEAVEGRQGQVVLRTFREGEMVVFACEDTGPGIGEEVRRDIFKPFFTTKPPGKGMGLGLYICHQVVERHGGWIEVQSQEGKGSAFTIRLPLKRS